MKAFGTLLAFLVAASPAVADPVIRQATGANAAAIQGAVDSFRTDLGGANNGNTAGSQASGRREINWDGGGAAANATQFPNPMTVFANRGAVFTTPGTATEISGQPNPEFGELNPTYPGIFGTFSAPRLFAPIGSNIVDVQFFVPGSFVSSTTNVPAASTGFGAVFTDVDSATSTKMEFFAPDGGFLGEWFVPAGTGAESLSFIGVSFNKGEIVGRVRITSGNAALGPDETGTIDVVAMDDFIYGEPVSTTELTIAPGTGRLFRTQLIELTVGAKGPTGTTLTGGKVLFNNSDVTVPFAACIRIGTLTGGGSTLRCPLPRGVFPTGDQVFQVELNLSNGTRIRNAVRWTIVGNTEP